MVYALLSALFALLLIVPSAAAAEPIHLDLRLVPGDTLHYTEITRTTLSTSKSGPHSYDVTMGMGLSIESALDDGAVSIRETVDRFEVSGADAESIDPATYLGTEFTFTLHPDGSVSDIQLETGDASLGGIGGMSPLTGNFPRAGLEVGKSYDTKTPLPLALPGVDAPSMPIHTTFEALVIEQDRPAARLLETVKVPEFDMPFGPFGATGTAKISADGRSTYYLALDTGWVLRVDGVASYKVSVQSENQQESVTAHMQMQFVMDDQSLNED